MSMKLLDEVCRTMRRGHYSIRTEKSYCSWGKHYVLFHQMRTRDDLRDGESKIEAFLSHLALDLHVAPSTQNQAMNACRRSQVQGYLSFVRRPCPVECEAYSSGVSAKQKIDRSGRPQRLPRLPRSSGRWYWGSSGRWHWGLCGELRIIRDPFRGGS